MAPGPRPHLIHTLSDLRNGANDPTTVIRPGRVIRATLTPSGPVLIDLTEGPDGLVHVNRHDGTAPLVIDSHPFLGDADPGHQVQPVHEAVSRAHSRYSTYRIPRTENPYHELLPAVLGQRVTAAEAMSQWRTMCVEYGVPLTAEGLRLHTPPDPDVLSSLPYTDLHLLGIDRRRADTLKAVARHADRLIEPWKVGLPTAQRTESLRLIPGVGQWTAALAGYVAFCDADALEIGDFHVKNTVAFALAGRHRGTDEEMEGLLAPYTGQRERVVRWLSMDGWHAPAHGPRRPNLSIARL